MKKANFNGHPEELNSDKMLSVIDKSGFPLEQKISMILEEEGFETFLNFRTELNNGKNTEINIISTYYVSVLLTTPLQSRSLVATGAAAALELIFRLIFDSGKYIY